MPVLPALLQVVPVKASVVATLGQWDVCELADGQISGAGHGEYTYMCGATL